VIQSHQHYAAEAFQDLSLEPGEIEGSEFHECSFERCSLVEALFRECRFVDCIFQECDLSMMQPAGSQFASVRFERSKVIGVDWTRAQWPSTRLHRPPAFVESALDYSTFIGLKLAGMVVRDCKAIEVDFREADLTKADFSGTDLAGSLFGHTNLTQANLSRARNYRISPTENLLSQARFSLPEAMSLLDCLDIVLDEV
jgi:fluoroquinolone resistance protein